MKVKIFDSIEATNEYLADKKRKNIEIKFQSEVVGQSKDKNGLPIYQINDRFLIIEE